MNGVLIGNGTSISLQTISPDLASQQETSLQLKSGATVVQDFRTFFPLPQIILPEGYKIKLQSSFGFLGLGYEETFELPQQARLGVPISVKGTAGSIIVVQLTSTTDVVLFERHDTQAITEALFTKFSTAGFVPRVNSSALTSQGTYNVIYAGADVPVPALREVVRIAADSHVDLRYIQPQVRLSNGLQYQIQIGSNANVACLPPISPATLATLRTASDDEFLKLTSALPKPGGC